MTSCNWLLSSLSLLDFPFFKDLLGTNSSISSSTLSAVLLELPRVHGLDDGDADGSKARSGWHESLVFTTSNKALNHLPNSRSSWYLFIPAGCCLLSKGSLFALTDTLLEFGSHLGNCHRELVTSS